MNDFDTDRIQQLWDQADELSHGEIQVRLLDEAVNLAEATRDIDLIFDARKRLASAATFGGHPEKLLPAFAWCLAHYQREPERFQQHQFEMLWYFKYVLNAACQFPQMTTEQFDSLHQQMGELYRQAGYNQRPVHYMRFNFALSSGHMDAAQQAHAAYRSISRDGMADCIACESNTEASYFADLEQHEKSLEIAAPILEGRRRCGSVPHSTYSNVLRTLALLGRYEEADEYQQKGYRLIRDNPSFVGYFGMQIAYLVHRDRLAPALQMLERHLAAALTTHKLSSQHQFYVAAARALGAATAKWKTRKLNLPQSFPLYSADGEYELAPLIDWFDAQATALAARFDQRNGNRYFAAEKAAWLNY
ncbi:hypothetical protein [Blastopirellula marina]|uniref:Tetratricopeptide repeat protein n=1 Tax=Blastopirellula marina TaxID=124 RepID=A0A2S8GHG3_9BACT|nr:hypothetical protein [Blastopirellula marina]PQO43731.1 hypothetical protein C5Y93_24165 [Blastopirellula marina]